MSFQAHSDLTHDNAHGRPTDLDPRKNGPFLDDVRRDQERAYREARMKAGKEKAKVADDDTQEVPVVGEEENNAPDGE